MGILCFWGEHFVPEPIVYNCFVILQEWKKSLALEGIVDVYPTPLAKIFIFDDFRANLIFKRKIIYSSFKFTTNKINYVNELRDKSNPRLYICTCSWRAVRLNNSSCNVWVNGACDMPKSPRASVRRLCAREYASLSRRRAKGHTSRRPGASPVWTAGSHRRAQPVWRIGWPTSYTCTVAKIVIHKWNNL